MASKFKPSKKQQEESRQLIRLQNLITKLDRSFRSAHKELLRINITPSRRAAVLNKVKRINTKLSSMLK